MAAAGPPKRLAEREITLALTDAARDQIASEGWDPSYGARPLKRAIQHRIENPLATRILNGEFGPGDAIVADYQGKSFVFERAGAALNAQPTRNGEQPGRRLP